jgi:hypothetical protein
MKQQFVLAAQCGAVSGREITGRAEVGVNGNVLI